MPPKVKTENEGADAAQVAAAPDPAPVVEAEADARLDADGQELCAEHFPAGWKSKAVTYAEERLSVTQPSVTCEHGTWKRPL